MERYNYVAGYKRKNRAKRDALKDVMGTDSMSKFRHRINRSYCGTDYTDCRGRIMTCARVRMKMQFRAYELVYVKKH